MENNETYYEQPGTDRIVFEELETLLEGYAALKKRIYEQYQKLVSAVKSKQITSEQEIERILNGLLDFGDDENFLKLYMELCRFTYNEYPVLVGKPIHLFQVQWDDAREKASDP